MSPRLTRNRLLVLKARALEDSPDAVVIGRLDGHVLAVNGAASRLFGCTARSAPRLASWFRDRDLRARARLPAGAEAGDPVQRRVELRRADGTRFRASITFRVLARGHRGAVAAHIRDLSTESPLDGAPGGDVSFYAAGGLPGPDALMARIGHDLNNPLAIVVAQATVLHDLAPDPDVARRAERIMMAAQRAGRIVESLAKPAPMRAPELSMTEANAPVLDAVAAPPALSVLIVDDEPDVAEALADVVCLLGHEAVVAATAEAALDAVRVRRFDAAIVDLHMPHVDGIALRGALTALDPRLAGRVAIVTGDSVGPAAAGLLGSFPTLRKPFALSDVRALLLRLAAR